MSWSHIVLTLGLCFGLGLGFAPSLRSAHACSCLDSASWRLALETITGDGDPSGEEAFWPEEASLADDEPPTLYLAVSSTEGLVLELERVQ